MEKLDLILYIVGGSFILMSIMWTHINKSFDKMDEKITDIDRRLCRLEGAFSSKDCCMIKDDKYHQKAE